MTTKSIVLCFLLFLLHTTNTFSKTEMFVNPLNGQVEEYETIDGWKEPTEENDPQVEKDEKQQLDEFKSHAQRGDYQAQRNLAWMYSTSKDPFISNKLLGCSWYKLILLSGSTQVGDGDIANVQTYCGKLSLEQQVVTEQQALRLHQEIYGNRQRGKAHKKP